MVERKFSFSRAAIRTMIRKKLARNVATLQFPPKYSVVLGADPFVVHVETVIFLSVNVKFF
jgi:hypothetical protein